MSRARTSIKWCLILLIVQSVSCDWRPNNKEKETLCSTPECTARGEEYKKNLEAKKAHPCQDFYSFTCGNWHKNHPGPKYAQMWSMLDVLTVDFLNIIRRTLESYKFQPGDNNMFPLVKSVYDTCVKTPEYPVKEANEIAREITKIGRVPKTPLWDIHSKYMKLTGISSLFRTKILACKFWQNRPLLMIMEPPSAYGSIFHEETWKPQEKQAYTEFLFVMMKSLNLKDPDTLIRQRIGKVFEFRKKLDQIIERNAEQRPETFNPFTGQELDKWFSETLRTQTKTQDIPWTEVIDVLLQNVSPELRRNEKIIAMRQKQYFLDLMQLLKTVPEDVLASHMEIFFVESHLKLTKNMYKLLEGTSVEPHGLFTYIRDQYNPRWQTCIKDHNMKEAIEQLLFYKWFPKGYPGSIDQLSRKIKLAIEDQMLKSNWLDKPTRDETAKKLNNVEEWIGFPPWIDEERAPSIETILAMHSRNKNEILKPDASLEMNSNVLYIHAPLLLPPMYSPTIPNVYNYAGIGSTLGHELYHVIDDCGSHGEGRSEVIWWPPAMRNKCDSQQQLFIDAYNAITDMDFKNRYNLNVKSDTSACVLENYPDVMGLEAAYNAYKALARKDKSACQTLPHFEQYSCDQMFYIAFANTFCGYYTKKSVEDKLVSWDHSIDSVRINGAVAQMKSFGTAFDCPAGSPMNPHKKVNLWQ